MPCLHAARHRRCDAARPASLVPSLEKDFATSSLIGKLDRPHAYQFIDRQQFIDRVLNGAQAGALVLVQLALLVLVTRRAVVILGLACPDIFGLDNAMGSPYLASLIAPTRTSSLIGKLQFIDRQA